MLISIKMLMQLLWVRLLALREDDRGMTTEAIIITAALAALAIGATGVIITKVRGEANSINVDAPGY
jgi:hypothetical protein